jgi:tetratricopeptide (TPR) repeat protein
MHYAFERACMYHVDGVESISDATVLADAFSSARDPLWVESSRWCTQLVRELADDADTHELIGAVRESPSMSDRALGNALDAAERHFAYDGFAELDATRAVFAHVDSRPLGLYRAGWVAGRMLNDLPIIERYYDRVIALAPGDHVNLEVWYAFYRSDVPALTRFASNKRLLHETRLDALKYMLARGADSTVVVALARELVAERECTWDTREDVVRQILEPARRFEDAARLYKEWLAARPGSRGDDRTYAMIGLARQYQSMGRLDEAWRTLPSSVRNCQRTGEKCHLALGALQRTALIALDRGDTATARQFAGYVRRYFQRVPHARLTLAEIEWRTGDDAAAAQIIADPRHAMSSDEWYEDVAPSFLRAVGGRPMNQVTRAFVTLISAEIEPTMLGIIPRVAWMRGRPDIAAALGRELARVGSPRFTNPRVYRYIKRAQGDSAALSWITSRWPPPQGVATAGHAYYAREFDLLWTITQADTGGPDGSFIWLMRALGELQQLNPSPERRRALLAHYRATGQGAYDVAGRYLMGLEPEAKIIALATSPKRRAEYSYYLAIKALGEGRHRDASDWLRVTVETRQARDGELKWAKDLLDDWWRAERPLAGAATHLMVSQLE